MAHLTRFPFKAAMAIAIAAALLVPLPAAGQALYGSITGTVSDSQGAAIPGATVTATNTGTGLQLTAVTDSDGNYTFRNLPPGVYDLGAALQGFRELKQTGLRVSAGNPVRVELKLEVGALAEVVNVVSESTLLQSEKADLSTELSSKDIVDLPLNQYPELPVVARPRSRRDSRAVPECRNRHPGPVDAHVGQRRAAEHQHHSRRRRGFGERLAAAPRRLHSAWPKRSRRSTSSPTTSTPTPGWPPAQPRPSSQSPEPMISTGRPSGSLTGTG